MSVANRAISPRRGVTLLELLVVMGIMVLLAAITIPRFLPAFEGQRVREAARALHGYLGSARNQAKRTGRPVGVMFERYVDQPQASFILRQVEVPPPYAGSTINSRLQIAGVFGNSVRLRILGPPPDLANGLIRRGDTIQLNYQGPRYEIINFLPDDTPYPGLDFPLDTNGYIDFTQGADTEPDGWIDTCLLTIELNTNGMIPWTVGQTMPFQIYRQPVPSTAEPLQLVGGAVVDLTASGTDSLLPWTFEPSDYQPVVVMFSPEGSVDSVYYPRRISLDPLVYDCYYQSVTEPLHFLIGKWERHPPKARQISFPGMSPPPPVLPIHNPAHRGSTELWEMGDPQAEDGLYNWEDATNMWVTLNPQTGLATVAEMNANAQNPVTNTAVPSNLYAARQFAREAQVAKGAN